MAKLGEAVLELKTDSAQLEKGLKDAEKGAEGLSKKFQTVGRDMERVGASLTRNLTLPLAAVGAAFAAATIEAGKYADKILDLEQITGLSTNTLQELEHVATVAGVSFDGLAGTIQRFSARLPQIEEGSSQAADAFRSLGVSLRDSRGEIRDMDELFPELITALQNVENVTERNAIAQQVFGRSLGDLAPVLGMTADEFQAVRNEAHELGLVLDGDSLNAANDYRVELETLGSELKALWRNFAVDLIPIIRETVIPAFRSLLSSVQNAIQWFGDLDMGLQKTIAFALAAAAAIGPAIGLAGKIMSAAGAIKGLGVAFGLSNPLLAAFLVTLTAIVAGVGFLIHRARTAAKERELLTAAITGNVESLEEYDEALQILEKREETAQKQIDSYSRGLAAAREELERLQARERELRAEGAGDADLHHLLMAKREAAAQVRQYEGEITRIRSESEAERTAIVENRAELEQQLREEQAAREAEELDAMVRRAAAMEAALQKELDDKTEAIETETEVRTDAIDKWLREQMDAHDRSILLIEERRDMLLEAAGDDLELQKQIHAWAEDSIEEIVEKRRAAEQKAADDRARIEREALLKRVREEALIQDRINRARAEALQKQLDEEARMRAEALAREAHIPVSGALRGEQAAEVDTAVAGPVDRGPSAADAASAAMIGVAMAAFDAMSSISGFSEAIDPLGTIMHHMASTVEPIVSRILPVVLGLYERIGAILGEMLVPIFEALGPILEILADLILSVLTPILSMFATQFQTLSTILALITPLLNALAVAIKIVMTPIAVLAGIFNWVGTVLRNLGRLISNIVNRPLRPGTWREGMRSASLTGHIRAAVDAVWTDHDLPGVAPGEGADGADGTRTGVGATYQQARPITINQDISDNFFLGGDRNMRDFALMLKEEFELLGVLNA